MPVPPGDATALRARRLRPARRPPADAAAGSTPRPSRRANASIQELEKPRLGGDTPHALGGCQCVGRLSGGSSPTLQAWRVRRATATAIVGCRPRSGDERRRSEDTTASRLPAHQHRPALSLRAPHDVRPRCLARGAAPPSRRGAGVPYQSGAQSGADAEPGSRAARRHPDDQRSRSSSAAWRSVCPASRRGEIGWDCSASSLHRSTTGASTTATSPCSLPSSGASWRRSSAVRGHPGSPASPRQSAGLCPLDVDHSTVGRQHQDSRSAGSPQEVRRTARNRPLRPVTTNRICAAQQPDPRYLAR
ncbi:hypothetical protein SAMN05444351_3665 [Geodermatophilus nigrescens]|uniref:Uncharacterized protein n=1 Tax=Geodermatophilus nigrescens TaxID=1070870 RepID=A0A1M5NSU2_9ACTN|nr:hypothetical protein SAMN05444351_3665 [Geodermatophilus nigrescens]